MQLPKWATRLIGTITQVRSSDKKSEVIGGLSDALLEELADLLGPSDPHINRAMRARVASQAEALNFDPEGEYLEPSDPFGNVRIKEDVYEQCDRVLAIFAKKDPANYQSGLVDYASKVVRMRKTNDEAREAFRDEESAG